MPTMPAQPGPLPALGTRARRRTGNSDLPASVSIVTIVLMVLIGLSMLGPLYLLIGAALQLVTGGEFVPLALLVGIVAVAIDVLLLLLLAKVRKGRRWAWITVLVILALYTAIFAAAGLYDLSQTGSVVVLGIAAIPALMILLLTAPRRSREYFRRGGIQP